MRSGDYWKERFEQIEQAEHSRGLQCCTEIEAQYRRAQRSIEGQLAAWYQRLADNNGVSMQEARRLVTGRELEEFKWDVNQYIKYGEENALNGQWIKELENASARYHISRLEAIQLQMQQQIEVAFGNQLDSIDSAMRGIYTDGYYRTAYEIQRGVGVGWGFATLDQKQVDKVINKPWAQDGRNFSDRVWSNKQKLVNELNTTLTQGVVLGKDPREVIGAITERLNVSKSVAGRLVMTESAAFSSAGQRACFSELGVEEYEIVATLDSHTSTICRDMDGQHFKMSEWEVGVTAPPFHVWCRTTTVPYFEDDFGETGERAAKDAAGKTYMVPADTTYKEWSKAFVDGDKTGFQIVQMSGKIKDNKPDLLMKGLPRTASIQANTDLKIFAEQFIDNLGIDRTHIQVDVVALQAHGQCTVSRYATRKVLRYSKYELDATDQRLMPYRIKTAFHEAFHLMADKRSWDAFDASGTISASWRELEEVHTECAAHYLLERYGVKNRLCPSYPEELVTNLPRLKQLSKYSSCSTIQEFGKVAFADRQSGQGAMWRSLSNQVKQINLPKDYYRQYYGYINAHEDALLDMVLENMPGYRAYRGQIKTVLASAMSKADQLSTLNSNESVVFFYVMACAMQKVGVL